MKILVANLGSTSLKWRATDAAAALPAGTGRAAWARSLEPAVAANILAA
jgi:hypothetical protein